MKQFWKRLCCTTCALLLSASVGFAADPAKPAGKTPAPAKTAAKKAEQQDLVDINSATDAELKELPGLGDAYIAKIVVNRPYANKAQLVSRNVIPESVYEKIKDRIIAKKATKDGKKKPEQKK